jgi:predicted PhzF superfamily epimerase YddE/YHI9
VPPGLTEALGVVPLEVFANAFNYIVLLESAPVVRALSPDLAVIARLDRSGVIVTAPGEAKYDFVSRYFAPAKGILEAGSTARSAPKARPARPGSAWPGQRWSGMRLPLSTPRPAGRQP